MFPVSRHAAEQGRSKGFSVPEIYDAANDPQHVYPSKKYPGQARHVRGELCAVVDLRRQRVVTVYKNVVRTPLRPDQIPV